MIRWFLVSAAMVTALFAVKVPITQTAEIDVAIGKPVILEFPFKIKGARSLSFIPRFPKKKKEQKEQKRKKDAEKVNSVLRSSGGVWRGAAVSSSPPPPPLPPEEQKKLEQKKREKKKPVLVRKGVNTITVLAKRFGHFTLIIWGYKEYPIMIDIKVVAKSDIRYYEFVDYAKKKEEAAKFESDPHVKVIVKLNRYLFNEKTPRGYTEVMGTRSYDLKDGNKQAFAHLTEVRTVRGKRYAGSEWIIKNLMAHPVRLYGQMFYREGVYSVAVENDYLAPGESTRLFIVHRKPDN